MNATALAAVLAFATGCAFAAPDEATSNAPKVVSLVITVDWGRTDPEVVERHVTLPVENLLKKAPRLFELRSASFQGGATFKVTLRDELRCDDVAAIAELLRRAQAKWPEGASAPRIEPLATPCT